MAVKLLQIELYILSYDSHSGSLIGAGMFPSFNTFIDEFLVLHLYTCRMFSPYYCVAFLLPYTFSFLSPSFYITPTPQDVDFNLLLPYSFNSCNYIHTHTYKSFSLWFTKWEYFIYTSLHLALSHLTAQSRNPTSSDDEDLTHSSKQLHNILSRDKPQFTQPFPY